MNKKYFFNFFQNEDEFLIASLWEDFELCLNIDFPVYTTVFLPPQISKGLETIFNNYKIKVSSKGLTPFSEKKVVAFYPNSFQENDLEFPIKFFKVIGSNKFKTLEHKDFLGGIMSLGIKRELLGDIIVDNNIGYSVTFDNILNILENNLKQINTIPVTIESEEENNIPLPKFKEFTFPVVSLRLDSIVSSLIGASRSDSTVLIERGDVSINYNIEKNKSESVLENSIITIKKNGKFIIERVLGETKKGKLKILVKQYI